MRRLATALVLAAASASLPGCIVSVREPKEADAQTPNGRVLSDLERRMDRVESKLPK